MLYCETCEWEDLTYTVKSRYDTSELHIVTEVSEISDEAPHDSQDDSGRAELSFEALSQAVAEVNHLDAQARFESISVADSLEATEVLNADSIQSCSGLRLESEPRSQLDEVLLCQESSQSAGFYSAAIDHDEELV